MLLGIKLKNEITNFERAEVSDALNETLHILAEVGLVDDSDDDGWSYVNPLEQSAPDLLAALMRCEQEARDEGREWFWIAAAIRKATGEEP